MTLSLILLVSGTVCFVIVAVASAYEGRHGFYFYFSLALLLLNVFVFAMNLGTRMPACVLEASAK